MPSCFRSTRTHHSAGCALPHAQDTLESQLKSRPAPEELIRGGILNGASDTVVLRTCAWADELRAATARTPCRGLGPDVARLTPLRSNTRASLLSGHDSAAAFCHRACLLNHTSPPSPTLLSHFRRCPARTAMLQTSLPHLFFACLYDQPVRPSSLCLNPCATQTARDTGRQAARATMRLVSEAARRARRRRAALGGPLQGRAPFMPLAPPSPDPRF
jgi:hypothetical protein